MSFENYFPLWNDLNTAQKKLISDNLITQHVKKGTIIHNGDMDCTGLLLVKSGQLRTYILSDEGREITLYRLFDMDMCLLSGKKSQFTGNGQFRVYDDNGVKIHSKSLYID